MDAHHDNPDNFHVHITPLKTYYTVFGALLFLTIVTVGVSYAGLPATASIVVAMAVAAVKASLVGAWFMHLKYDTKFNVMCFLSAFWFVGLFFIFTTIDLGSRDSIMAISGNRVLRAELMANGTFVSPAIAGEHGEEHGEEHGDEPGHEGEEVEHADEGASDFDAKGAYATACAACHGEAGDGNGPAGAALTPKPRDFTDAAWWDSVPADQPAKVIKAGGMSAGLSPIMAGFGGTYDDDQIAAMVEYLQTFKK